MCPHNHLSIISGKNNIVTRPGDVVPPSQDLFYNFLNCMALVSIHQVIQPRIEYQTWLLKVATMSQKLEDLWVLKNFSDKLVTNMRGCPCIMNKIDPPCICYSNIKHCNKLVIRFVERGASTVFRVCRKRGAMTHDSSSFFLFLHTLLSNFLLLPPLFEPSIFFEGEKKTTMATMAIPNIQIWVKEKFPVSMLGNKTY